MILKIMIFPRIMIWEKKKEEDEAQEADNDHQGQQMGFDDDEEGDTLLMAKSFLLKNQFDLKAL